MLTRIDVDRDFVQDDVTQDTFTITYRGRTALGVPFFDQQEDVAYSDVTVTVTSHLTLHQLDWDIPEDPES